MPRHAPAYALVTLVGLAVGFVFVPAIGAALWRFA